MWARSSWKPFAARVEENLLGCHVVAVEKSGEDTGLLVDTLLSPELLAFGEIRDRVGSISTGRAYTYDPLPGPMPKSPTPGHIRHP